MWRRRRWKELVGDVGSALVELVQTEVSELADDLMRSQRQLAHGLIWIVVAASFGVWIIGLLVVVAVAALALWMDVWAAALLVATSLAVFSGIAAYMAWRRLQRFDRPGQLIRERWEDHVEWWKTEVVGGEGVLGPGPSGDRPEVEGERDAEAG